MAQQFDNIYCGLSPEVGSEYRLRALACREF